MTQTVTITSKRQITIPVKLYNELKLKVGQSLIADTINHRLMLTPAEQLVEELGGSISVPKKYRGVKNLDALIEKAKEIHFREKYAKDLHRH